MKSHLYCLGPHLWHECLVISTPVLLPMDIGLRIVWLIGRPEFWVLDFLTVCIPPCLLCN